MKLTISIDETARGDMFEVSSELTKEDGSIVSQVTRTVNSVALPRIINQMVGELLLKQEVKEKIMESKGEEKILTRGE